MKFLRALLDSQEKLFRKGGPLEKAYPLFEAMDTFAYTPGNVTRGASHVHSAISWVGWGRERASFRSSTFSLPS